MGDFVGRMPIGDPPSCRRKSGNCRLSQVNLGGINEERVFSNIKI